MKDLILLTLLAAGLVACGGNRHSSGAKTTASRAGTPAAAASPPSLLPPDVLGTLRRYALTQADLPQGYTLGGTLEEPNDQAASDYADPAAARQEIAQTGRKGGLGQQVFPPPGSPDNIGVSVELFADAAGAQRWAGDPPSLPASMSPSAATLDQPPGDRSSAIHWTQGGESGYVINFNRGPIVYGVGVKAPAGQESLATALDLARRLDEKAKRQTS